ncbi:MAG: erythromycin esterase family protein [Saprospiraceae bacterium]
MKYSICLFILIIIFASCKKDDDNNPNPEPECILTATEEILINQLSRDFAYLFNGADPDLEDEGLNPLIDYIGDAKLVGLGEATHGTAEFYKMKDKIFRKLVTQKGFKAIIFEIPWGNAKVVNDFVTKGVGSADEAIDQTWYWTYDTQEVRDLAQWIHDYNLTQSTGEKIHFVGCDPQGGDFNIERNMVFTYLNKVQPDSSGMVLSNYGQLPLGDISDYSNEEESIKEANKIGTKKVYDYFVEHKDEMINFSSEFEYEVNAMAAHLIQHREYIYRTNNFGVPRDSLMAIYSEWWQSILAPEAKVAIWAHNFHVMDARVIESDWMGTYLRQRNGANYKNVAFSFGKGAFNAFRAGANGQFVSGVSRQTIPTLKCHSTNHLLSLVDGDQHYLIFDELENESKTYFESVHTFIQLGAGFNYSFLQNYTQDFSLSKMFDVLIHFDETNNSELK